MSTFFLALAVVALAVLLLALFARGQQPPAAVAKNAVRNATAPEQSPQVLRARVRAATARQADRPVVIDAEFEEIHEPAVADNRPLALPCPRSTVVAGRALVPRSAAVVPLRRPQRAERLPVVIRRPQPNPYDKLAAPELGRVVDRFA